MKGLINVATSTTQMLEVPAFKNEMLNKYTADIAELFLETSTFATRVNRDLSLILAEVLNTKCYEEDGFKSVADYAEKTFGIKRQNAYAMAKSGNFYNNEKVPEELKALPPSKAFEISSLPDDVVTKGFQDGEINVNSTQADLRNFAKKSKATRTTKVEPFYYVKPFTSGLYKEVVIKHIKMDEVIDYLYNIFPKDYGFEVVNIGNVSPVNEDGLSARFLVIDESMNAYLFGAYRVPEKSDKPSKKDIKKAIDDVPVES